MIKTQTINNLLMNKTIRAVLIHLSKKEDYALNISRKLKTHNSNITNYLKLLSNFGLVELDRDIKRRKYYKLIDKGKRVVELFYQIDLIANEKEKGCKG